VAQALYQGVSGLFQRCFRLVSALFQACFNGIETPQPIAEVRFSTHQTPLFHIFLEKSISASKNAKCGNACT
jgi:hypothetical protein